MAGNKKAVKFLRKILEEKGPLPAVKLAGYLSQTTEAIREAAGRNADGLLAFVKNNPMVFTVLSNKVIGIQAPKELHEQATDLCRTELTKKNKMAANKKAVQFLKKILEEKGPLPVVKLAGYLSQTTEAIREAAGRNADGLLAFVKNNPMVFTVLSNKVIGIRTPKDLNEQANDLCRIELAKFGGEIGSDELPKFIEALLKEFRLSVGQNVEELTRFLRRRPHIFYVSENGDIDLVIRQFLAKLPTPSGSQVHTLLLTIIEIFNEADTEIAPSTRVSTAITPKYVYEKLPLQSGKPSKPFERLCDFERYFHQLSILPYFKKQSDKFFSLDRSTLTKDVLLQLFIRAILEWEDYVPLEVMKKRISPYRLLSEVELSNFHVSETVSGVVEGGHFGGFIGVSENVIWASSHFILKIIEQRRSVTTAELAKHVAVAPVSIRNYISAKGLVSFLKEHPRLFGMSKTGEIYSKPKVEAILCVFFKERLRKHSPILVQNIGSHFQSAPETIKHMVDSVGEEAIIQILRRKKEYFSFSVCNGGKATILNLAGTNEALLSDMADARLDLCSSANNTNTYCDDNGAIGKPNVCDKAIKPEEVIISSSTNAALSSAQESPVDLEKMAIAFLLNLIEKDTTVSLRLLLGNLLSASESIRDYLGKSGLQAFLTEHPQVFGVLNERTIFSKRKAEQDLCAFFKMKLEKLKFIQVRNVHSFFNNAPDILKHLAALVGSDAVIQILKRNKKLFRFLKRAQVGGSNTELRENSCLEIEGFEAVTPIEYMNHIDASREEARTSTKESQEQEPVRTDCSDDDIRISEKSSKITSHGLHEKRTSSGSDDNHSNSAPEDAGKVGRDDHQIELSDEPGPIPAKREEIKRSHVISNCEGRVHCVFKSWALMSQENNQFQGQSVFFNKEVCTFISKGDDLRKHIHKGQDLMFDLVSDDASWSTGGAAVNVRYKSLFFRPPVLTERSPSPEPSDSCPDMGDTIFETDLIRAHVNILMHLSVILLENGPMDFDELYERFIIRNPGHDLLSCEADLYSFVELYEDFFTLWNSQVNLASVLKMGYVSSTFKNQGFIKPLTPGTEAFFGVSDEEGSALKEGSLVLYIDLPISSFPQMGKFVSSLRRAVLILLDEHREDEEYLPLAERNESIADYLTNQACLSTTPTPDLPLAENEGICTELERRASSTDLESFCTCTSNESELTNMESAHSLCYYVPQGKGGDDEVSNSVNMVSVSKVQTQDSNKSTVPMKKDSLGVIPDLFLLSKMIIKLIGKPNISMNSLAKSAEITNELRKILKDSVKCKAYARLHPELIVLTEDEKNFKMTGNPPTTTEWRVIDGKIITVTKNAAFARISSGEMINIIRKTFFFPGDPGNSRESRDVAKAGMPSALEVGEDVTCICLPLQKEFINTELPEGCQVVRWQSLLTWQVKYNQDLLTYTWKHSSDTDVVDQSREEPANLNVTKKKANVPLKEVTLSKKTTADVTSTTPGRKPMANSHPVLKHISTNEELFDVLRQAVLLLLKNDELSIDNLYSQVVMQSPSCQTFLKSRDDLELILKEFDVFTVSNRSVRMAQAPSSGRVTKLEQRPEGECGYIYDRKKLVFFPMSAVLIPREPHRTCHLDYELKIQSLVEYVAVPRWPISAPQNIEKTTAHHRAIVVWPKEGPNTSRHHPVLSVAKKTQNQSGIERLYQRQTPEVPATYHAQPMRAEGSEENYVEVGSQTFSTGAVMMTKYVDL